MADTLSGLCLFSRDETPFPPSSNTQVFSSSCTVYGEPKYVPLDEKHPLHAINPYGRTKLMVGRAVALEMHPICARGVAWKGSPRGQLTGGPCRPDRGHDA